MSRRPLRGLLTSLLLHVIVVTAALAVMPRSELLPALFVDLTVSDGGKERGAPAIPRSTRAPSPRAAEIPRQRTASSAPPSIPERRPLRSAPASPTVPEESASAPPSPAAEPPAIPPAASRPAPEPPSPQKAGPGVTPVEPEIAPESAALHDSGVVPEAMPGLAGRSTAAGGSSVPDHFPTDEGAASPASDSAAPDVSRTRSAPRDGAADAVGSGQEVARSTPTGEGGAALQGLYAEYLARLRQLIHEALRYPPAARRRGLTGVVTIELTVVPSGEINDVSVVQSSSHPLLDDAAVETVQELRAQRFPTHLPRRPLRVRLPVVFQLE